VSGLYLPFQAELNIKNAGRRWRPSNGTEGELFRAAFCDRCEHGRIRCTIEGATFAHQVNDPEYPNEWQFGADGQPTCTAFEAIAEGTQ
jgi:hypothetical protein